MQDIDKHGIAQAEPCQKASFPKPRIGAAEKEQGDPLRERADMDAEISAEQPPLHKAEQRGDNENDQQYTV